MRITNVLSVDHVYHNKKCVELRLTKFLFYPNVEVLFLSFASDCKLRQTQAKHMSHKIVLHLSLNQLFETIVAGIRAPVFTSKKMTNGDVNHMDSQFMPESHQTGTSKKVLYVTHINMNHIDK